MFAVAVLAALGTGLLLGGSQSTDVSQENNYLAPWQRTLDPNNPDDLVEIAAMFKVGAVLRGAAAGAMGGKATKLLERDGDVLGFVAGWRGLDVAKINTAANRAMQSIGLHAGE